MALLDRPLPPLDERKIELINTTLEAEDTEHDMVLVSHVSSAAARAAESGDVEIEQVLGFVARLLLIRIEGLDHEGPATTMTLLPRNEPDDVELETMRLLAQRLTKPIARARIADLVWQRVRDHRMGQLAVQAYLEAGAPYEDPDKWTGCTHRYRRALQLAASLGKSQPHFTRTLALIEAALQKHGPTDTSFLSRELMDILLDHKRRDAAACTTYAAMAEGIAQRLETSGELFRAQEYWAVKEKWEYARGDEAAARASRSAMAECLVKEAELELANPDPSHGRAALLVRQAIGILDKLQPESRPRVAELRQLVAELNAKEASKPRTPSEPFDVSDVVAAGRKRVEGKPLPDALVSLATITRLPSRAALEAELRSSMKGFLQYILPTMVIGPGGTLVAARAGMDQDDPDADPLTCEMVRQAQIGYGIAGIASINAAREAILAEHDPREHHFAQLAYSSRFVPPGREENFAKGLDAGMHGDFVTALHLLIPQLENSLRHLLKGNGENTIIVNRKGFDEERDLDDLLRLPKTKELIGEDLCFSLRALLLHRFGPNLRNLLSHGLLDPAAASSAQAIYVWWLTLHLCYAPLLAQAAAAAPKKQHEPKAQEEKGDTPAKEDSPGSECTGSAARLGDVEESA
jgi:hypothetical protein